MSSIFGNNIKVSVFGQSHSNGIGVVIDGLPAGEKIDMDNVMKFLSRRSPSSSANSTARRETDEPHILSGLVDSYTCGAPLCAVFENSDTRSQDYEKLKDIPRPAHADFPAFIKNNGFNDVRGGGHFSARLTAPLCFAGAVCIELLKTQGIYIGAHIASIGKIRDTVFDPVNVSQKDLKLPAEGDLPIIDKSLSNEINDLFLSLRRDGNSVGGSIECCILGMPVGIGEPMFDGVENRISSAVFAVPAVKGIEFGAGFKVSEMLGSENNDPYYMINDIVKTKTNNHGGILGGLSSGMPIIFKVAMKPTPSIYIEQDSVSLSKKDNEKLLINGRHDVCIVPRAVPCIEAAAAIAIYDLVRKGV